MLDGQVAVITGSAVGIGRAICIALAEQGARIAGLDIDIQGNLETSVQVRGQGQECLALDCDLGDSAQVRHAINQVVQAFGRIDILINNAAVFANSSLLGGSFESQSRAFDRQMRACAFGAYYCALAAAPVMRAAGGGNIINLVTEHVKEGYALTMSAGSGYDCAKYAQWRLTEIWAAELKPHRIRVNALCFGATDTPMLRAVSPAAAERGMKPEDLAQAVLNILAHGPDGPTGNSHLFGPSGTPREESLKAIAALAPATP